MVNYFGIVAKESYVTLLMNSLRLKVLPLIKIKIKRITQEGKLRYRNMASEEKEKLFKNN